MASDRPELPTEGWRRQQIEEYRREYAIYRDYAEAVRLVLERLCERVAPLTIVQARAKSVASFAGKLVRRWPQRTDPVRQFTDLCGARVITSTEAEAARVREFIGRRFHVVETEDTSRRLGAAEFGYGSVHYVVQPMPAVFEGVQLPVGLGGVDALLARLGQRRAEIQVRTFMQHAWAEVMHDRVYKTRVRVPEAWRHEAARQAALLEQADREFSRMVDELDSKLEHHDAYMTAEELDREIAALGAVLESESEERQKPPLVLQIARLCHQRRAWARIIEVLSPWTGTAATLEGDTGRQILVELGRALCTAHPAGSEGHAEGLQHLEAVGRPDTIDIDSIGALGIRPDVIRAEAMAHLASRSERPGGMSKPTRDLYQKAVALDPDNPYRVIEGLWAEALWHHDLVTLRPLVPRIQEAARACQEHADLGIELPRAYFGLARCRLFLQQYDESLAACAKAVEKSDVEGVLEELTAVEGLQRALGSAPPELDWIVRFLRLAHVGKLWQVALMERAKAEAIEKQEEAKPEDKTKARQSAEAKARAATEEARKLRTPGLSGEAIQSPVIVVAGGTDPLVQDFVNAYCTRVHAAFEGFAGTIVSGGTRAGIAGLVGEIAERQTGVTAMAYLPRLLPHDAPTDTRYVRLYKSKGESFSPLQPLEAWEHLLASEIRPNDVRVLGINGGRIAAFEYQLALALGAAVGLVEGSGRAVTDLLPHMDFWPAGRLLRLPDDVMTLRAFINPAQSALSGAFLEAAAQVAHTVYVSQQLAAEQQPWEVLRPQFRESTRQQVLYAAQILAAHGYRVDTLEPGHVDPVFTAAEIESMAEMEHGRWNIERLKAGWRYGEPKNIERQISPYLVEWNRMPEHIKDYDREAVKSYPKILRAAGLGIYRGAR